MMASELKIKDFDFIKLQIKQEKDVSTSLDNICDDKIILKFEGCDEASNTEKEQKLNVTPIKSSNEILAELFQVFNAAPPTILLNDDLLKKKEKKKHKSKKHKKKSRKYARSSSSENSTISQSSNYKSRKKKKKKEKKYKSDNDNSAIINETTEIHENNEKVCAISELQVSEDEGFGISSMDVDIVDKNHAVEVDKSIESSRLKESTVPAKIEHSKGITSEKKFYERETLKDGSSDLSLSDEETYLKEKQFRYYSNKSSYERKTRHESRRRYSSRDRSKKYFKNSRSRSRSRSKDRHR